MTSDIGTWITSGTSCSATWKVICRLIPIGTRNDLIASVKTPRTIRSGEPRSMPTRTAKAAANADWIA